MGRGRGQAWLSIAVLSAFSAVAADDAGRVTRRFHGIPSTDPGGRDGLLNPDRGFRMEIVAGETQRGARHYPLGKILELPREVERSLRGDEPNDLLWIRATQHYRRHGITMALAYIYLTDFSDGQPLPAEKLAAIDESFRQARLHGFKLIPLFVYEAMPDPPTGPTATVILEHIDQLGPVLQSNADVMPWLRAGFVGAFGEWHNSFHNLLADHAALERIVSRLLDIVPKDKAILMRVPKYKRWVLGTPDLERYKLLGSDEAYSGSPKSRLGHANDGFMVGKNDGFTWPEPPHFSNPQNPEFTMATVESAFTPTEGELFVKDVGGAVDGFEAAVRFRLHHYCAFSFFHGNSELERYGSEAVPDFPLTRWMKTPLVRARVEQARLPVSEGYFEDALGRPAERTEFEYIRDHLGYRIELQDASWPGRLAVSKKLDFDCKLINRGFATMHNPRPVRLVLINERDEAWAFDLPGVDCRAWQPFAPGDPHFEPLVHTIKATVPVPANLEPGRYRLGIWLPDRSRTIELNPAFAVRLANRDTRWWVSADAQYGVNVLGELELAP
jgi:hypothetical protein